MTVFGKAYSSAYDSLYGAKDYVRECEMIETLLGGSSAGLTFLDIGCGTGGHAVQLATRGNYVIGVDRSAEMLDIARRKTEAAGVAAQVEFLQSDLRALDAGRTVDVALMMFAVLGYQQADKDVSDALQGVARHLRRGGVFIFDVWYGPAVVVDPPGARQRTVHTPGGRIVRTTESTMLPGNLCQVGFKLERYEGERLAETVRENHMMRYFFPEELKQFAADSGFVCERIDDFNVLGREADSSSWNALTLFRKC
jgi:ubiquinone/menaquinone biosynthesis C-methylase UbiE